MTLIPEIAISKKVLDLTTFRHQLIANNIANANTPQFKRTDISFVETLNNIGERTAEIQRNSPPDLLTDISADLSKGKEFAFLSGTQESGDMGVAFARSSLMFDYQWYQGMGGQKEAITRSRNKSEVEAIEGTQPIVVNSSGSERLDGNNVNVDLEISEMIKNNNYYNMLVSIVSGDFRVMRTIITAR